MTNRPGYGDECFDAFYRKHMRRVRGFFKGTWRLSDDESMDLAQDVFLRAWASWDKYRGDAEWAYLEEIARNVLYNRIRAQQADKRRAELVAIDSPDFQQELPAPPEPDYAEREEAMLIMRRLHAAIAQLPPGQRQVLDLQMQGYSYAGIATVMRITEEAVKSRRRDALRTLRDRLSNRSDVDWLDQLTENDQ